MKKLSLLFILLVISTITVAQNPCQEILHSITSSSHSPVFEIDPLNGATIIYYDLCVGEELTLIAEATFPENNTSYTQSMATTEFTWYVDETDIASGTEYTNTYNTSGGFILAITSEDVNGCDNIEQFPVFVRVSTIPTLNLSANPSSVCPDIESFIGNDPSSDVNINVDYVTGGWNSTACVDEFSEPLYLPDGSGVTYNTDITLACFGEGQTLTDVNDIVSINVNMEHSFSGDLDMYITAPNGVEVQLFAQAGSSTWFGEATDNDATATNPGIGYDYGWSMNPTYNGTMAEAMANGNTTATTAPNGQTGTTLNSEIYLPLESLDALLGTPLNGIWTITIVDNLGIDNGWIFSWGISINADVIPSFWSYNNFIVDEYWAENSTIISSNGTDLTILPTSPGIETYTYIIEDNFGCTYSEQMLLTITSPVSATSNSTNDICGSDSGEINLSISGGTQNYSVNWNDGEYAGQNITSIAAGTYNYLITDAIGCIFSGVDSVITEIIELEFDYDNSNDICDDEVGVVNIVPTNGYTPYNYNWNFTNLNSPIVTDIGAGTYIAAVTDNYGCEGVAITSIINEDIELEFDTSSEFDHCDQDIGSATVIPLNGLAPYSFNWDDGFPDNATAQNINDGAYDVLVTDDHGCVGETTVEVLNIPAPVAYFETEFDTVVYNTGLVEFLNLSSSDPTTTISDTYWSFGEGTFSEVFQPSNNFNQIGTFIVELTVTDSKNCTDNYFKEIVSKEDYLFFPPTAFSPNGDNINDVFKPIVKDIIQESYQMYIYDRWGELVFETKDFKEGWDGTRIDKTTEAKQDSYSFIILFNTFKNETEKKTGTFVLIK